MIGFGTYKVGFIPASASAAVAGQEAQGSKQETARECVLSALECGYRFLDCAQFYGNEKEVGLAIKDSGIPREELFLASKVFLLVAGPLKLTQHGRCGQTRFSKERMQSKSR